MMGASLRILRIVVLWMSATLLDVVTGPRWLVPVLDLMRRARAGSSRGDRVRLSRRKPSFSPPWIGWT